jgi:hypothetical protein
MTVASRPVRLTDRRANLNETRTGLPTRVADKRSSRRQNLARSIHRDAARKVAAKKRWTTNDISAFGVTLTLVLLGTILAANTNQPVFWLLIGPGPLAVGFTFITFFRQGFGRRHSSPTIVKQNHRSSSQCKGAISCAGRSRSKEKECALIVPGF